MNDQTEIQKREISENIRAIFEATVSLHGAFSKKRFTIDGRLVGDIGEVLVELDYDLILFDKQMKDYDAVTPDNRMVQIKATFKNSLTFKNKDG